MLENCKASCNKYRVQDDATLNNVIKYNNNSNNNNNDNNNNIMNKK